MEAVADDTENSAPTRPLGQTLAAERERHGLSRADVAQRLHMSAYQIEAIETGDYARLPRGTFLRGFVRNYAKLLGIAADPVLALLPDGRAEKKPAMVVPTQNIRFDPIGERFQSPYVKAAMLAVVAIAAAFAGMYWWLFIRPAPPATAARTPPVEAAPAAVPSAAPTFVAPEALARAPAPSAPLPEPPKVDAKKIEPPKVDAKKMEPPKAAAEPPRPAAEAAKPEPVKVGTPNGSTLKFRFKGESWVEIRDARGRIVFSRLNPADSEAEVSGKPPLNVIVGNAPEVKLIYNDREFNLEPHTKVAVARFTVE